MRLQDQLATDMKAAMKARDTLTRDTLRLAMSACKNKAVELGMGPQGELGDDVVQQVLATEVKRRRDSATQYADAGRDELAAREEGEIDVLERYLPKQLSDDELVEIIDAVLIEHDAAEPSDMGRVMKPAMAKVAGRADGGRVSAMVKQRLAARGGPDND